MALPIIYHHSSVLRDQLDQQRHGGRGIFSPLEQKTYVRIEKAPRNSRRIFASIDIPTGIDEVWNLLTDYENLQSVVPNLTANEVLEQFTGINCREVWQSRMRGGGMALSSTSPSNADQCKRMAKRMKGSVLKQAGGAKFMGISFSARTTLEVREWPMGMPDFAHDDDNANGGKENGRKLTRYVFPRPFTVPSLPRKDISMQSIETDDGEFRMYQGVWRMQPLPGCSRRATRLTFAVEVSPRVPVKLVEERIAQDLSNNLEAIRDVFTKKKRKMGY